MKPNANYQSDNLTLCLQDELALFQNQTCNALNQSQQIRVLAQEMQIAAVAGSRLRCLRDKHEESLQTNQRLAKQLALTKAQLQFFKQKVLAKSVKNNSKRVTQAWGKNGLLELKDRLARTQNLLHKAQQEKKEAQLRAAETIRQLKSKLKNAILEGDSCAEKLSQAERDRQNFQEKLVEKAKEAKYFKQLAESKQAKADQFEQQLNSLKKKHSKQHQLLVLERQQATRNLGCCKQRLHKAEADLKRVHSIALKLCAKDKARCCLVEQMQQLIEAHRTQINFQIEKNKNLQIALALSQAEKSQLQSVAEKQVKDLNSLKQRLQKIEEEETELTRDAKGTDQRSDRERGGEEALRRRSESEWY